MIDFDALEDVDDEEKRMERDEGGLGDLKRVEGRKME